MSRLRRIATSDRFFFITCRVDRARGRMDEFEMSILASVIAERRKQHGFLLTAWVFLPDHWHAIFCPQSPLTISRVLETVKVGAAKRINGRRGERGIFFQGRFFDRVLRTVKEYSAQVEYIHLNPVKAGLVDLPEKWKWSSVHDYTGTLQAPEGAGSPLPVDRFLLPADPRTRI